MPHTQINCYNCSLSRNVDLLKVKLENCAHTSCKASSWLRFQYLIKKIKNKCLVRYIFIPRIYQVRCRARNPSLKKLGFGVNPVILAYLKPVFEPHQNPVFEFVVLCAVCYNQLYLITEGETIYSLLTRSLSVQTTTRSFNVSYEHGVLLVLSHFNQT